MRQKTWKERERERGEECRGLVITPCADPSEPNRQTEKCWKRRGRIVLYIAIEHCSYWVHSAEFLIYMYKFQHIIFLCKTNHSCCFMSLRKIMHKLQIFVLWWKKWQDKKFRDLEKAINGKVGNFRSRGSQSEGRSCNGVISNLCSEQRELEIFSGTRRESHVRVPARDLTGSCIIMYRRQIALWVGNTEEVLKTGKKKNLERIDHEATTYLTACRSFRQIRQLQ